MRTGGSNAHLASSGDSLEDLLGLGIRSALKTPPEDDRQRLRWAIETQKPHEPESAPRPEHRDRSTGQRQIHNAESTRTVLGRSSWHCQMKPGSIFESSCQNG